MSKIDPRTIGMIKTKTGWLAPGEVAPEAEQRDSVVRELCGLAAEYNAQLEAFKQKCEDSLLALVSLNLDIDEPKPTDLSGWYESLDGEFGVQVDYNPVYRGTEVLIQVKELLRGAIEELTGKIDKIGVALLRRVLRIEYNSVDIKQLERLTRLGEPYSSSSDWCKAVVLIPKCYELDGYQPYYRFFSVDEEGNKIPVMRNFSSLKTKGVKGDQS